MRPLPIPDLWHEPLHVFETHMRAQGMRESAIQTRLRHIHTMARRLPQTDPNSFSSQELTEWVASQTWAPETRHAYYVSIRKFFSLIRPADSPATDLPSIERPIGAPRPIPEALYQTMLDQNLDERTRTILILAGQVGLRRSEVAQVHRADLLEDLGGWSLSVIGKGGRRRVIPLTASTAELLLRRAERDPDGWIFPSPAGGHLDADRISKIARVVPPKGWSLHTLRHRFATRAYASDRDLLAVQRLLGHTSVATTQRYTAPPDDALRKAAESASHS